MNNIGSLIHDYNTYLQILQIDLYLGSITFRTASKWHPAENRRRSPHSGAAACVC